MLEFALAELWNQREGRLLTHAAYDAIGEVEGAISRRADDELARWSVDEQQRLLRQLTRLVRVAAATEEGTDTRQRVSLTELDPSAQAMVRAFADARLLVMSRNEATDEETVEVAHEALIRNWPRLRDLLNEDRAFLLWRQRLHPRLDEWKVAGRDRELLLKGAPLQEAHRWLRSRESELNEEEREFIRTSARAATSRKTQGIVLAAATGVLVVVGTAWFAYSRTDRYQVNHILADAPAVVPVANDSTRVRWSAALALSGRGEETLAAARQIDVPNSRASALAAVASALAAAGQPKEARRAVIAADSAALLITNTAVRSSTLSHTAQAFAGLGMFRQARLIADRREVIDDDRLNAYAAILREYAKKNNPNLHGARPGSD